MAWLVSATVRFIRTLQRISTRKWTFLVLSLAVFFLSFLLLARLDLLPDPPAAQPAAQAPHVTLQASPLVQATSTSLAAAQKEVTAPARELPVKIMIPSINLSAPISNPETTNIQKLDDLLLKGAVRYPLSATLGEQGNVIIFGHSSYLPFANPVYKTFDGIQHLKKGDRITVYSQSTVYVYSVDTESKKSATSAAIPLAVTGQELTLSTCDSFGKKTDRFIVTAHLVDSYPIGK